MTTKLMLDSGAYSAFTQKKSIDVADYIEYVKKNEANFEVYFNLDVLSDGGRSYSNWIYMKAAGLNPIPVFHIGTDERFLERYLKQADYIAIGAIANMSTSKRMESLERIWHDYLSDSSGMPIVKAHAFGLTSIRVMRQFPWYSVDSTSWVMFGRYGAILVPRSARGKYVYDENPYIVTVSSKSPKQSSVGQHFNTYSPGIQDKILKYIEDMGFKIGGDQIEEDGIVSVVEEGVSNVHYQRDQINMLYYLGVQNSIPEWPWPMEKKKKAPYI